MLVNAEEFKAGSSEAGRNAPTGIQERIKWNDEQKRASGHILCEQCHKILCKESKCRLCQLTGWRQFETICSNLIYNNMICHCV